jgi:D-inositol-3-phosphate glycosyltransferase
MDESKCLQEIRRELGLDDLVMFVGSRAQEVLPYYYAAAEACVMPSLYESFGMVALEAMACGTPVIASRVGGLTFTVRDGETGFLVPEKDPKALAEKLELVLTDECLRRRLGRRAVQVAASYSWDIVADDIGALYTELGA